MRVSSAVSWVPAQFAKRPSRSRESCTWGLLSLLLLASSLPPHISEPLLSPNRLRVFHCLCLSLLPFRVPSAWVQASLLPPGWEEHLPSVPGPLGLSQVPEQASRVVPWPPTRPKPGLKAWQPSALRPPGSGRSNLGASCPARPWQSCRPLRKDPEDNWGVWGLVPGKGPIEALACQHGGGASKPDLTPRGTQHRHIPPPRFQSMTCTLSKNPLDLRSRFTLEVELILLHLFFSNL